MFCFTIPAHSEKCQGVTVAVVFFALCFKRVAERRGYVFVPDFAAYRTSSVTVQRYVRVVSLSVLSYGQFYNFALRDKLFEIAINGCEPDIGNNFFALAVYPIRTRVVFCRLEYVQDRFALS